MKSGVLNFNLCETSNIILSGLVNKISFIITIQQINSFRAYLP